MRFLTEYLTFRTKNHREYINITPQVEAALNRSGIKEGMILVSVILFLFLGNVRGAVIVAITIPFALLFASICLGLCHIPANLLSLGALDFGMVVDGAVVMIENIVRHLGHKDDTRTIQQKIKEAAHEVQRPVFYAIAIIITAYLPIFTLQSVEAVSSSRWRGP